MLLLLPFLNGIAYCCHPTQASQMFGPSLSLCIWSGEFFYIYISLDLCTCTQGASSVFGPYADNKILEFDLMSNKIQFGGVDIFSIGNNGCNCG